MFKVLVIGSKGQLGSEIHYLAGNYRYDFFFTDKEELDIIQREAVKAFLDLNKIEVIINCSAYTAVDKAESEGELADLINHQAVVNLAEIAKERRIRFLHVSTDYVFEGKGYKPYLEEEVANPQNVYGKTKLAGEEGLKRVNPDNSIIIRTSWVYSSFGNNFVKTMIRLGKERDQLKVIDDQIGSPTYARDLAQTLLDILPQLNHAGVEVFHYNNEGVCSWFDFAKAIMEIKAINCDVSPQLTANYPTPAIRPHYSVLNKYKIKKTFNLTIPYWRDSLRSCLDEIKQSG
ncbi:dTDP-4-dehydrorhamnose reductase [Echinicola sediminis]